MGHELQPSLIAIANEYGNCKEDFAHDCLFTPVASCTKDFKYRVFDKDQAYKTANSLVSCYSQVHELQDIASELVQGSVDDFALEVPICRDEIEMQKCACSTEAKLDLEARAVKRAVKSLMIQKEKRAMDLVLDQTQFPAAHVTTIAAGSEFNSGTAAATDPLALLHSIIVDAPFRPYNMMMTSHKVMARLQKNACFLGDIQRKGVATPESIRSVLGLDAICISRAKADLAAFGLPANRVDIVDNVILLFYRNDSFDSTDCGQHTFAFEAWYQSVPGNDMGFEVYTKGGPGNYQDNWDMGLRGGFRAKVGYSSKFVVADYELGHLILNPIDPTLP